MDNALRGELLHHVPGNKFVVLGSDEAAGDGFEALNEAGEIVEAVVGLGLGQSHGMGVMARTQLHEQGGRDGALEMKMQLGLGEAADEFFDSESDSVNPTRPIPTGGGYRT